MSSLENSPVGFQEESHKRYVDENSLSAQDSHPVETKEQEKRSRSGSKSHSRSASYSRRRHSDSRSRSRSLSPRSRSDRKSRSRSPRHRRHRSRSPRRSYSPQESPRRSSRYGRHDNYSYDSRNRRRDYYSGRRYDRAPARRGGRYFGNRDCPEPCRCLGVFGLSLDTHERDLRDVFGKYGPIENAQVVYDAQSGRSRGFAFVYFEDIEDAKWAKDECDGLEIDGRKIRVDFSVTRKAHTPTPGVYMGKPSYSKYRDGGSRDRGYRGHSQYYGSRDRYSRSRSRSYEKY